MRQALIIGIITLGISGRQGLNFAVAIDHARDILDGRQVTPPAGALTLEGIGTPSGGQQSESQRIQDDGAKVFEQATGRFLEAADALDVEWKRFRTACYSVPISGSFDREWFAGLSPGAMPTPVPAGCATYFSNFKTEAERFGRAIRASLENARRAGVLPDLKVRATPWL